MTRNEVLTTACDKCLKELYQFVYPKVKFKNFIKQCKKHNKKYKLWESLSDKPNIKDFCGPKPYEFYYLPKKIMDSICESYVYSYRMDVKQEFLDNIKILKDYCKNPIIDKYIEGKNGFPGHRGYEHPDNLAKEIAKIISNYSPEETKEDSDDVQDICNKFFEFLDMAGKFYNWNFDLNSFNTTVYLGASPNSNKEAVIKNWKKYRGVDIEIDEEKIIKEYYGDDE